MYSDVYLFPYFFVNGFLCVFCGIYAKNERNAIFTCYEKNILIKEAQHFLKTKDSDSWRKRLKHHKILKLDSFFHQKFQNFIG